MTDLLTDAGAKLAEAKRLRAEAVSALRELIKQHAITLNELTGRKRLASGKYVGPKGERWAGRGRKPAWVLELEAKGIDIDQYRVGGAA